MKIEDIRKDLKEIRYYYSHKQTFDEAIKLVGENHIVKKAKLYNEVMLKAPANIFYIYVSLYTKYHSQESLADSMCVSPEYICRLNNKVVEYIQLHLD